MGVLVLVIAKRSISKHLIPEYSQWFCASWLIFRFFGLSSGCIAVIMSIDRYIVLNHPIFYHENLTRKFNRNAILALTLVAGIITFFPLFGFGIYFDEKTKQCLRYREATNQQDRAYAILFLIFGSIICLTIVTCNTFVIRALLYKKPKRLSITCALSSQSSLSTPSDVDVKFSKLMALLSLIFVVCWMPQMISIILALKSNPLPHEHWFYKIADLLTALLFTLDPYIYVLSGKNFANCWSCRWRRRQRQSSPDEIRINNTLPVDLSVSISV